MTKAHRACTLLLRFIAVVATVASCIIMVTGHQTVTSMAGSFEAKYTYMPAFKYFVIANAVISVYSFLVLFLPSGSLLWRSVVAMDLIIAILLASCISAAAAITQVGKKGNSHAGWLPICGQVSKFCDHVTGALAAGFVAFAVYMILVLYAVHMVLDPLLLNKSKDIDSSSFRL